MIAPPATRKLPRPAPAESLRRFYAHTAEATTPADQYSALTAAWSEALGAAPVALFCAPRADEYRLMATAGWPGELPAAGLPLPEVATHAGALNGAVPAAASPISTLRQAQCPPELEPVRRARAVYLGSGSESGLLLIGARPDGGRWTRADQARVDLLIAPTTVALRATMLADSQAQAAVQFQALADLGEELSGNLDLEAVYNSVYIHLRRALAFDSFFISIYDRREGLLTFPFAMDEDRRYALSPSPPGNGLSWTIYRSGQPLVIHDLLAGVAPVGTRAAPFGTQRRSRSWMGVPMIAGHQVIGVLSVHSYTPNLYHPEQVQFLSTVANHVAGILENALLLRDREQRIAERVSELAVLDEVARLLNASLNLDQVIGTVVARGVEITGAMAGVVALFDPATRGLHILGHVGYPADLIAPYVSRPFSIDRGLLGRAVRENATVLSRDTLTDPDYVPVLPETRSQLVVPVRRSGQVIGILSLESSEVDGFKPEVVEFTEHLAEHAALAIDNARRYERERSQNDTLLRRTRNLAAVVQIGNALNAQLSENQILLRVVEAVRSTLGFNVAVLSMYRDDPPRYERVAAAGVPADVWQRLRTTPSPAAEGQRLMSPQFQISQSYFIPHDHNMVSHLPHYHRPDAPAGGEGAWHPDDMLVVPLRSKDGAIIGALSVDDPADQQIPTRGTIETLEIFANQTVTALENARLFAEQRLRLRELGLLQEIGLRLTAMLDPMDVIGEVARAAVQLFDMAASAVVLVEDPSNPRATHGAMVARRQGAAVHARPYPPDRFNSWTERILAEDLTLVVPDAAGDEDIGPPLVEAGYAAGIAMPLRAGGQGLGVIYLLHSSKRTFALAERQLMQIFTTQVAVAIQNARLFDEESHRVRDLTQLQAVGLELTAQLDVVTLIKTAARLAIRLIKANSSGVLILNADPNHSLNVRCWFSEGEQVEYSVFEGPVRPGGLTSEVLASAQPLTVADTTTYPGINQLTVAAGIRSQVAVPIQVGDTILGVLFVNGHQPRAFAVHEQQLLQVFATQVAVALQNARLFEERRTFEAQLVGENQRMARELATARATQRQLLPVMPQRHAGLRIHGLCQPAMEVGGDYYDVVPLPDGRVALALGDVTGKGTSAVMLMAMIKTAMLSQIALDPQPMAVLRALNVLANEYMQGQLMTFFYAIYDPRTRQLTYANAGHLFPYVRRLAGPLESLEENGLPLGAGSEPLVDPGLVQLVPGDLFVLFSDGIVEAMNATREFFGFARLEELLAAAPPASDPRLLVEDIVDRVHTFADSDSQDDVTLFIARVDE